MDERRILVFDLVCSCWLGRPPEGMRQEVIEVGFCILDMSTTGITDKKSIIIKPENSVISTFCEELTGISQSTVDKEGISFKEACRMMMDEYATHTFESVSWGKSDVHFLKEDCSFYGVPYPLGNKHSNAQKTFRKKLKMKNEMSVKGALAYLGKEFQGTQHRASDDAYNTAMILADVLCGALDRAHGPQ